MIFVQVHFEEGTGTVTSQRLSDYTAELLDLNPSPFGGANLGKSCHGTLCFDHRFSPAKPSKAAGKNAQERLSEDSCRLRLLLTSQHASAVSVVEYFLPMLKEEH